MDETKGPTNNRKAVYTIVERDGGKPRWIRIGIAFVNRDGSYSVFLDALPTNGQLHIRDFSDRESAEASAAVPEPVEEKPATPRRRAVNA